MISSHRFPAACERSQPAPDTRRSMLTEPAGVAVQDPSGGAAEPVGLSRRLRLARRLPAPSRDALALFGLALGLRLVFSILMANTFDEDEFVYLALGRDVAHEAVPYRDFAFFHPPGILAVVALLNPIISWWWPVARLVSLLIDSGTVVLVGCIGSRLYGRRAGWAAAILYAVNPVVLVAAVRVDQEVLVTALGTLGLTLVVTRPSKRA
ncbi:MAG: hypothetical protein JOZ41_06430, partial [Chloroflexi bacterium]|nr:hypothetical protein [Chloroflexota bacterium]